MKQDRKGVKGISFFPPIGHRGSQGDVQTEVYDLLSVIVGASSVSGSSDRQTLLLMHKASSTRPGINRFDGQSHHHQEECASTSNQRQEKGLSLLLLKDLLNLNNRCGSAHSSRAVLLRRWDTALLCVPDLGMTWSFEIASSRECDL